MTAAHKAESEQKDGFRGHHSKPYLAILNHQRIEEMEIKTTIQGLMVTVKIVVENTNAVGSNVSPVRVGGIGACKCPTTPLNRNWGR